MRQREVAPGWTLTTWEDWPSLSLEEPSPSIECVDGTGAEFDRNNDLVVNSEGGYGGHRRTRIPSDALSALLLAQAQRGMRRVDRESAAEPQDTKTEGP